MTQGSANRTCLRRSWQGTHHFQRLRVHGRLCTDARTRGCGLGSWVTDGRCQLPRWSRAAESATNCSSRDAGGHRSRGALTDARCFVPVSGARPPLMLRISHSTSQAWRPLQPGCTRAQLNRTESAQGVPAVGGNARTRRPNHARLVHRPHFRPHHACLVVACRTLSQPALVSAELPACVGH